MSVSDAMDSNRTIEDVHQVFGTMRFSNWARQKQCRRIIALWLSNRLLNQFRFDLLRMPDFLYARKHVLFIEQTRLMTVIVAPANWIHVQAGKFFRY